MNKQKLIRWCLTAALAVILTLGVQPMTAQAVGIQSGTPELKTDGLIQVGFVGKKWWVIGNEAGGIIRRPGTVTLYLKVDQLEDKFSELIPNGTAEFRYGATTKEAYGQSFPYYDSVSGFYYQEPLTGDATDYPGSTLQKAMETIANGLPAKEMAQVSTINVDYEIHQKLWPLSSSEFFALPLRAFKYCRGYYWLRNRYDDQTVHYNVGGEPYMDTDRMGVIYDLVVRPALNLNLSTVLFTSDASGGGMKTDAVGSISAAVSSPSGIVKFTMKDTTGQKLKVLATKEQCEQSGSTLLFDYSGATTGTNQYISCVLTDTSGAVKYYGKLADSYTVSAGTLSVPLAGVADGSYSLKLFSEQANGINYSDFCSEPVTIPVEVASGNGTVINYKGELTSMTFKHALDKTAYRENEQLDLSGLVVTLHRSSGSTEDVAFADFNAKGITVTPANGTVLQVSHNKLNITHTGLGETIEQTISVDMNHVLTMATASVMDRPAEWGRLTIGVNLESTAYYVIRGSGEPAPTKEEVLAGTSLGLISNYKEIDFALYGGERYIYVVIIDDLGNVNEPYQISFIGFDPPVIYNGSVNRTGDTEATISFHTNGAGTAYYLVQNSGTEEPVSLGMIVAGGTSLGYVKAGSTNTRDINLTAGSKDIYVVVRDDYGNLSERLRLNAKSLSEAAAPDSPQNLTVTYQTGQVDLSWSAPLTDGGSPILSYEVWTGDGTWLNVGSSTSHTVTGIYDYNLYTFKIRAVNAIGKGTWASIIVYPPEGYAPMIYNNVMPNGKVGSLYSKTLALFYDQTIICSIDSGSLPEGLTLDTATGEIYGIPTSIGTYHFTVKVTNSLGSSTKELSIVIEPEPLPTFAVAIGSLSGGSITASPATAVSGSSITLTIKPDTGKRLKAGSLKYNDGAKSVSISETAFTMPAANVIISAEFEDIPVIPVPATTYTVTIGTLTGGSITASPTAAVSGSSITLLITPDNGKQLKAGSLKYNDGVKDVAISGNTFVLPESNVTISAEFEDIPVIVIPAPTYTVTIGTLNGGSITASPAASEPGRNISLSITPDSGKRLKAGSLKYNDGTKDVVINGTSFTLPDVNVTVTAEFEDIPVIPVPTTDPTLVSIGIPAAITGVANGTAKSSSALGLPATVAIITSGGNNSAAVVWDVASSMYDHRSLSAQSFTVTGRLTLPAGVVNTNNINLSVTISVTVNQGTDPNTNPNTDPNTNPNTNPGTNADLPSIAGSEATGWDAITQYITDNSTGSITVDMNGESTVEQEVFEAVKGKDIDLTFDLGNGIEWIINGTDIPEDTDTSLLQGIDFDLSMNTDSIPTELMDELGDTDKVQISLEYDGSFGFTATLRLPMDEKYSGKFANLFYYNPLTNQLELQAVGVINSNGTVEFPFTHASDYVVVISDTVIPEDAMKQIVVTPAKKTLYVGGTKGNSVSVKTTIPDVIQKAVTDDLCEIAITYQSSNPKVAAVSDSGKITAKKAGTVTITTTVKVNGVERSYQTTIKVKKAYIKLTKSTKTMKLGETYSFQAKGYGVETDDIIFTTSQKDIVTIKQRSGAAVAKSLGTDYVVAKAGDCSAKLKVVVSK